MKKRVFMIVILLLTVLLASCASNRTDPDAIQLEREAWFRDKKDSLKDLGRIITSASSETANFTFRIVMKPFTFCSLRQQTEKNEQLYYPLVNESGEISAVIVYPLGTISRDLLPLLNALKKEGEAFILTRKEDVPGPVYAYLKSSGKVLLQQGQRVETVSELPDQIKKLLETNPEFYSFREDERIGRILAGEE